MRQSDVRLLLIVLVAVPLSLLALGFDAWVAYSFARQAQSPRYPSVMGTITRSQVRTLRGGTRQRNTYFSYDVRFAYEVEGRKYEGDRLRFYSEGDFEDPGVLARHFRVNDSVPVFYRPGDPTDAILEPGVKGTDVLALMTPGFLNLLALLCWSLAGALRRDESTVPAFEHEGRTHVTLPALPPGAIGLLASMACMFLGKIVVHSGASISVTGALGCWAASVAVGLAAAWVQRWRLRSGALDLILDERARQLSLPAMQGRWRRLDVPWSQVVAITRETRGQVKKAYRPVVEFKDARGAFHREPIGEWTMYPERFQPLVDWLGARVKPGERRAG